MRIIFSPHLILQSTSNQPPLKGVHLANAEDIRHKNWLSEYTRVCMYMCVHVSCVCTGVVHLSVHVVVVICMYMCVVCLFI